MSRAQKGFVLSQAAPCWGREASHSLVRGTLRTRQIGKGVGEVVMKQQSRTGEARRKVQSGQVRAGGIFHPADNLFSLPKYQ